MWSFCGCPLPSYVRDLIVRCWVRLGWGRHGRRSSKLCGEDKTELDPFSSPPSLCDLGQVIEIHRAPGCSRFKRGWAFPLPEDPHRQIAKSLAQSRRRAGVQCTLISPSLYPMGISRHVAAPSPRSGQWHLLQRLLAQDWCLLYLPPTWIPCLHHECFPQTLGVLKLDCNSLCESRSVAVDSFMFKAMLSYGAAASFTKSLWSPNLSKQGDWRGWPWKVLYKPGVWDSLRHFHHIPWGVKWSTLSCTSCCHSLGRSHSPPLAPHCLPIFQGATQASPSSWSHLEAHSSPSWWAWSTTPQFFSTSSVA